MGPFTSPKISSPGQGSVWLWLSRNILVFSNPYQATHLDRELMRIKLALVGNLQVHPSYVGLKAAVRPLRVMLCPAGIVVPRS